MEEPDLPLLKANKLDYKGFLCYRINHTKGFATILPQILWIC